MTSLGVIAEDATDGAVMRVLVHRVLGPQVGVHVKSGKGCAWFWSCDDVLTAVARKPTRGVASPQGVVRPKEALEKLSRDDRYRARYSTNDNARLAAILDLARCRSRCPAFAALEDFLRAID